MIKLPLLLVVMLSAQSQVFGALPQSAPAQEQSEFSTEGDWTLCSIVHLANQRERDYIVIGQRFLTGAHATHFWVYREMPQGMRLVLTAFADSLSIEKQKTNGLRDIAAIYYSAVTDGTIRYTFDGTTYRTKRPSQYR